MICLLSCRKGNWMINLFMLLCNFDVIISEDCNSYGNVTDKNLPLDWPNCWTKGTIPFAFDFYSLSPRRLISLVHKGHNYLQRYSCLIFKEHNPVILAQRKNFTYLYYTYSGVLESCCLQFQTKSVRRRVILISPLCTLPSEVAHVTLHALGLTHWRKEPFSKYKVKEFLFPYKCRGFDQKIKEFNENF
ncbi:uncharacterized protein LOC131854476 [Achroia grisella]|uniref:uncharacterized protein LOC131854476 n=1 Tax=Achroia grisella TaxID=688607 RepID=UPI0027D23E42|nr:uncharacterized protein LOC131854476 [Achroia grisella]